MRSLNSGHPRQSTDLSPGLLDRRSPGQAEYVLGMYSLLLVMVIALVSLQIMQYKADSDIAEDALAASCLAALDVDPYRYGTDHRLVINDPVHARDIFDKALRENMQLKDDHTPVTENDPYIYGKVSVDDFRVYVVDGDLVTEYRVSGGRVFEARAPFGEMKTPSGKTVSSAGTYAKISFDTRGFAGVRVPAVKEAYAEMVSGRN